MAPKKASTGGKGGGEEDRVRVVVRIRPPVRKDEKFGEGSESLQYDKERNLLFLLAKEDDKEKSADPKQFVFDKVLWKDSVQYDAWEAAGLPVVNAVLEGYTGCVMCYGQTGAGKSFTLANESKGNEGVMIQAFNHIFKMQAESRDLKYEVSISYQQIYLDTITDLLNPGAAVEIRENPATGVYVDGAKWEPVDSAAGAIKVLQKGNSNRNTSATKMNSASSRSHAALIVKIVTTGGTRTLNGMLYLVDLAGSERVKKSGVEGAAFDEAKAINQSLTTLGRCIEVLASNKKEKPPFRESKLTRLLSNAIGGGAKTTLIICCAPTLLDSAETIGSLDFGQQAMNVVVRAKVNASTDYGSLTASLLAQRDKKNKPIRELELQVLQELAPQLDEVVRLEQCYKAAALEVEVLQDTADAAKEKVKQLKKQDERDAEAGKEEQVRLLNERSSAAAELEQVLVSLSSDPEIKEAQEAHEAEKKSVLKQSAMLQEQLQAAEAKELSDRKAFEKKVDGVSATARNLGQTAAFFLQSGEVEEAASFYMQAKTMFDGLLGPDHPKTQQWQEDLFFLINAPAIQQMVTKYQTSQKASGRTSPDDVMDDDEGPGGQKWWTKNLFEMGDHTAAPDGDDDDAENNWWMASLFGEGVDGQPAIVDRIQDDESDADFMQLLFGSPRDGSTTPRGGPAFTPRGTLVALSEVSGNKAAVVSLGKPLQKQSGIPEDTQVDDATVNMEFAKEWINKIFETPRGDHTKQKSDAFQWLQQNFGGGAGADAENVRP